MFSSTIGRSRFFFYSVGLVLLEAVVVLACIFGTIGVEGLATSEPGPGRESLALAIFVTTLAFAIVRSNIALRRARDARLTKWVVIPYIVFTLIFVVLQSLTFLVHDFNSGEGSFGLGLLGLALMGMWFRIWLASPAGGGFDPDAFLEREGLAPRPSSPAPSYQQPTARPAAASAMTQVTRAANGPRRSGFGKRGIA